MWKLDPIVYSITYSTNAFDLYLKNIKSYIVGGQKIYISQNNAYWTLPSNIFDNQLGLASPFVEVKIKLVKYINNPFEHEINAGAYLE
jgi:hypothetical protein